MTQRDGSVGRAVVQTLQIGVLFGAFLDMFTQVDALVLKDPELAAVVIAERLRKLQARYEALR